jgi:hypothetical protein
MARADCKEQSAFFRMTDQEVGTALRGWLLPAPLLESPVLFRGRNPFTGEPVERWSRVSNAPILDPAGAIRSPSLDAYPWISSEGLQPFDMMALTEIVLKCPRDLAEDHCGRFLDGPEDANDILQPVSPEFVHAIATLPSGSIETVATTWLHATDVRDMIAGWHVRVVGRTRSFFREGPESTYYFWTCR